MRFRVPEALHVEQVGATTLILRPVAGDVVQLDGLDAQAFALAQCEASEVPDYLTTPMAGLVALGVVEASGWSRRHVLQMGGAAAAAAVTVFALPSIAAATSHPGTPSTTVPLDPNPCVLFDWGSQTSSTALSSSGTGKNSNVRTGSPGSNSLTVTDAVVGTVPPVINGTSYLGTSYRNFQVNTRPYSGEGSISGYGNNSIDAGLVLVQDNSGVTSGIANPNVANITNYQEVTFTFANAVTSLTFTVYDLSATAVAGASTGYMDAVGFSAVPTVISDSGSLRTVGGQRVGTGSFSDPFRRVLATDNYWGADPNDPNHNIPLDIKLRFSGPLTELKLRYSSIAGPSTQFIKIGDMQTGGGCTALPAGY